jgi:hypothetical protein
LPVLTAARTERDVWAVLRKISGWADSEKAGLGVAIAPLIVNNPYLKRPELQ